MKRKPIIAGNWKMNKTMAESMQLVGELQAEINPNALAEVVVCVPYTDLITVGQAVKNTNIKLGAQNVGWADSGAFTGEISAAMLKELGVEYVVIGHSERRQMFGETDTTVNSRTIQALKNGLKPIVCVGETEQEKEDGKTEEVNKTQIMNGLIGISDQDIENVIIAYEPVWAIGTGKTATSQDANNTIKFIRSVLAKMFGDKADLIRIQYGGSMNAANAEELLTQSDIDGGLIGGASLKAKDFSAIVNAAEVKR